MFSYYSKYYFIIRIFCKFNILYSYRSLSFSRRNDIYFILLFCILTICIRHTTSSVFTTLFIFYTCYVKREILFENIETL